MSCDNSVGFLAIHLYTGTSLTVRFLNSVTMSQMRAGDSHKVMTKRDFFSHFHNVTDNPTDA